MSLKFVYSFQDYREFLRSFYLFEKRRNPDFSHALFAKRAGLKSANYLNLIISGKRNLTIENIHRFGKAMRLAEPELRYFETLVLLNQSIDSPQRRYYGKKLKELGVDKPSRGLVSDSKLIVSKWYFPALLLLLHQKRSPFNAEEVAKRLRLTVSEVSSAERQLLSESILRITPQGLYEADWDHMVFRDRNTLAQSQKAYLKDQLKLSCRAFDAGYDSGAKFNAHTFTVSNEKFDDYVAELTSFIGSLIVRADQEPPERVVQLNTQFFRY